MNFANRQLEMIHDARLDNDSTSSSVTMSFTQGLSVKTGNNGRILYLTGVNTGNNTFSGVIGNSSTGTGATQVRKQEGGKWILGSNNTYTGKTTVDAGTLEVSSLKDVGTASSVGAGSALQLGYYTSAGTLRYVGSGDSTNRSIQINDYTNGASNTGAGIILNDGSGAVTFTAPTFIPTNETVVANRSLELGGSYTGAANEIQGIIQDIAPVAGKAIISVVKRNDASTWVLSGDNSYKGTTTVNGGTLLVNGNSSAATGAVAVNNAAVLGGDGTLGGAVTLNGTSTLSPGNSPGSLGVGGLTLGASITALMELGGTVLGTDYDNVTVATNGTLSYGGDLNVVNYLSYDMEAATYTYDLFAFSGTTAPASSFGSVTVNSISLSNSGGVWTGTNGPVSYTFTESTGDLAVVVPEPASLGLLGLGGLLIGRRRR